MDWKRVLVLGTMLCQRLKMKTIHYEDCKMAQHNDLIKALSTAARVISIYTVDSLSYSAFIRKKAFFSECD